MEADVEKNESKVRTELRWWLFPGTLVIALIIGFLAYDHDAFGVNCETSDCQAQWAEKRTDQFNDDKLGNAEGLHFPKAIKRRITRKMEAAGVAKPLAKKGVIDWWKENLKMSSCIIWNPISVNQTTCGQGQKAVTSTLSETMKIFVRCGGLAVVGTLKGGGGWGAGKAGGGCLFAHAADKLM